MGLLKRILSLGSKKSKKKRLQVTHAQVVDEVGMNPSSEDATEVAANLLLRSSSARYAVVSETDYTSLPPLPHPINSVLSTPTASTTSIASSTLSQRGTYTVKVHSRERHACTEFPNANPDITDNLTTPRPRRREQCPEEDTNHLLGLRRDPSVASLLDLYDQHGRLPSEAFSNTPPKEGRAQTRRTGSTLRQLMGNPESGGRDTSTAEGDISWAERFLRETNSAATSVSSLSLQTPDNFDAHFPDNHLHPSNACHDASFTSDDDPSSKFLEHPTISSMEVELSVVTEPSDILDAPYIAEPSYIENDPKTPLRASQIFGFLTEKRKSRPPEACDRSLPELPSAFSSPSDKDSTEGGLRSHFSSDHSSESAHAETPAIPYLRDTPRQSHSMGEPSNLYDDQPSPNMSNTENQLPLEKDHDNRNRESQEMKHVDVRELASGSDTNIVEPRKVKVIMTAPTRVIVTAPTPCADDGKHSSRIPRGPRSLKKRRSANSVKDQRPGLLDRSNSNSSNSNDVFTSIPSRPRKYHRTPSASSTHSSGSDIQISRKAVRNKRDSGSTRFVAHTLEKENKLGLSAKPDIPFTPIRANSSRSLFRTAVTPQLFRPPAGMAPSPASSSELSPVGQKIMLDARRQRSKARGAGKV